MCLAESEEKDELTSNEINGFSKLCCHIRDLEMVSSEASQGKLVWIC